MFKPYHIGRAPQRERYRATDPQHMRPSMASGAKAHTRKPVGTPHKRSTTHRPREQRTHAAARGYDHKWAKFRTSFLASNPLCEYCMARGRVEVATVCDHDLPHEQDAHLFWDNTFTACCAHHHNSLKQRLERQYKGESLLAQIRKHKGL
jgi:5-methylcytosine-specific restriction protein A